MARADADLSQSPMSLSLSLTPSVGALIPSPMMGTVTVDMGSAELWPLVVSVRGQFGESSVVCNATIDFQQAPATMSLSLVPTNIGSFKRTNIELDVEGVNGDRPISVSGTIGYDVSSVKVDAHGDFAQSPVSASLFVTPTAVDWLSPFGGN
eukprot:5020243-Prymnesium_polylepis.1